jgi:DNA-binding NtrC family response regulator
VLIEEDKIHCKKIIDLLSEKSYKIIVFNDAEDALNELHTISPDLILLDLFVGHTNGLYVLQQLRMQGFIMPVVMLTPSSDIKMAVRTMKSGAEDFIVKPIDNEQLEVTILRALKNFELSRRVQLLSEQLKIEQPSEIIGKSVRMLNALAMAKTFSASSDTTVLLLGESGTGKELMARYIHENSPRAAHPFVTINCGAIPRDIAENELFGYEKGAFTGATEKVKQGKFELAHRGTILLDEIAELSTELQVKLLRVLQEKRYYRLGGAKEISVDVRIIASTNKNLEELTSKNQFREDLFYRLNVARIELPPLRDRGEDILILATEFITEFNKSTGKNIKGFDSEASSLLMNYGWKGNIRELRNVIERVVLLETNETISKKSLAFLSQSFFNIVEKKDIINIPEGKHYLKISDTGATAADVNKDLISQTMKITGGDKTKAAKMLGLSESKIDFTLEQYGLD